MEKELYEKYLELELTDKQIEMFYEILSNDIQLTNVFQCISNEFFESQRGLSISQICELVKIERRVGKYDAKTKKTTYEKKFDNISRRNVEDTVKSLSCASLIYVEYMRPYKYACLTLRGAQVAAYAKQVKNQVGDVGETD